MAVNGDLLYHLLCVQIHLCKLGCRAQLPASDERWCQLWPRHCRPSHRLKHKLCLTKILTLQQLCRDKLQIVSVLALKMLVKNIANIW